MLETLLEVSWKRHTSCEITDRPAITARKERWCRESRRQEDSQSERAEQHFDDPLFFSVNECVFKYS
jgi:hypothetical protein